MKKIFLFLSAVLVSLAMQATVITKSVDWTLEVASVANNTFTVNAWASASKWDWMTGADEYDQLVIEVAAHTENILVTANFSDGSADIASAGIMRVGTNSIAVDVTNPVLHGIEVKNFSGTDDVTISVTNMYLRKAIGPKKTVTLWEGSMYFDDFKAWDSEIILAHDAFADAHIGDILEIDYTLDESGYYQMSVQTSYHQYRPTFLGTLDAYNNYIIEKQANPNKLSWAIMDETDLTKLKEDGGLRINGALFTATAVKLIKHDVLWTGEQETGNWEHAVEVSAAKVADLKVGNIICVRVSEIGTEDAPRVTLADGTWTALVDGERYFQGGDEAPMLVEFPVTYKMEQQLRGKNLLVRGVNYTMTDIYVLEGTPVNTVASYLPVTSAGMATFIVPFNVQSLPDGVQAYELTNNGDATIWATEVNALEADKPVLILAAEGEYEFISEEGASDDISSKTDLYTNGALIGTYQAIDPLEQTTGGNFNYILSKDGDGNVGFYQVRDNSCSVPAYRAYLSCGYNASSTLASAPKMHIVFHKDNTTGIENQELKANSQKLIRNGQLFIIRDGRTYNALGVEVK